MPDSTSASTHQRPELVELSKVTFPWVYITKELAAQIKREAWFTCRPCYGTGWTNYGDFRNRDDQSKKEADCPECHGWGVRQV